MSLTVVDPAETMAAMTHKEVLARSVARRLREAGYIAYFAGGCVRDRLLGRDPDDFDIATDAPAETVQRLFPRTVPVGAQFGVVLVLVEDEAFEVATFRSDSVYLDGRRPVSVRFSSPEEDARRRDFTINGMFLDPHDDRVIDYVGGQRDLQSRVIRAIGDPAARIREDRLRMLRAVRFAARLGYELEPQTFRAVRAAATMITDIAWERIGDEIVRMLTDTEGGSARRAFELLDATRLLRHVLPEIEALKGVEQSQEYHPEGDVFIHTLGLLGQLEPRHSEALALGALLHDVGKPRCAARINGRITFYGHCEVGADMAVAVCQRLRRSRHTWERVAYLVRNHLRLINAPRMRLSSLKRFLAEEGIEELLELARIDAIAASGDLTYYNFCMTKLRELGREAIKPEPLLRGRDLLDLGFSPGPQIGVILDAVAEAQLEGTLHSKEAAAEWVRQHFCPDVR